MGSEVVIRQTEDWKQDLVDYFPKAEFTHYTAVNLKTRGGSRNIVRMIKDEISRACSAHGKDRALRSFGI